MRKTRIYSNDENERIVVSDVLNHVFGSSLKLLHPFMPFVTSDIYSQLICFATAHSLPSSWPTPPNEFLFDEQEIIVEKLNKIIIEIRNIRAKMNVHPTNQTTLIFVTPKSPKCH